MTMRRMCLIMFATLLCLLSMMANISIAGSSKAAVVDRELAERHEDFEGFALQKVQQLNKNHKFSRSRMKLIKQGNGTYRARYHQIDDASVKFKVRRSSSSKAPYVAILSYREQVYEYEAKNPAAFNDDLFAVVEIIPNRHIFSYQKGAWK